jgi:WD40 repeat protein
VVSCLIRRAVLACLALTLALPIRGEEVRARPRTDPFGDPLPEGALYRLGTVRLRHWMVTRLSFLAGGARLLSVGWAGDLRVWDVATGRLVRRHDLPDGHSLSDVVASPDGRLLAAASKDRVLLLDAASGRQLAAWGGAGEWQSLAFTRDGKFLVGLGRDRAVHRWDVASRKETGRRAFSLADWPSGVTPNPPLGTLSPDGAILAGVVPGDLDKDKEPTRIRFWDVATGRECREALPIRPELLTWSWSPDGRLLLVQNRDYRTRVWEVARGKEVPLGGQKGGIKIGGVAVALAPDGRSLAVGGLDSVVGWDLETGEPRWHWRLPVQPTASGPGLKVSMVSALALRPDGKTLAVGATCGHISLLDMATGAAAGGSRYSPGPFGGPLYFSPAGGTFVVRTGWTLSLRTLADGEEVRKLPGARVEGWSPDGRLVVLREGTGDAPCLRAVDAVSGEGRWRLPGRTKDVTLASDGKAMAFIDEAHTVRVIEAATGREVRRFRPPAVDRPAKGEPTPAGYPLGISADFRAVVARSPAWKSVQAWDLTRGDKLWEWQAPADWGEYWSLRFLPGGRRLAVDIHEVPEPEESLYVLDAATGAKQHGFQGRFLAASSDGRLLALSGPEVVTVRDAETGRLLVELKSGVARNNCFAFAPDGGVFAHNPDDSTIELREAATGRLLVRLSRERDRHYLHEIVFAPDGRTLAAAYNDSSILAWDATGLAAEAGRLPRLELTPADVARLWQDLGGEDGPRCHRAFWVLAAGSGSTVAELRRHLRPVPRPEARQVAALIADLDGDDFRQREKAMRQLERMEGARGALVAALEGRPSLEARQRIRQILEKLDNLFLDPEVLRRLRAVQVLEQVGGPEARALLDKLASGGPEAHLTREAKSAIERLARRLSPAARP